MISRELRLEGKQVKSIRELRKLMNSRMVQVPMSESDVLLLHALSVFSDGRRTLTKMIRKRISPVAMKILAERKEYH